MTARSKVSDWPSAPSNKYGQLQQQQQSVEADSRCSASGNKWNFLSVSHLGQHTELHFFLSYVSTFLFIFCLSYYVL
jgi:hypothetical protein